MTIIYLEKDKAEEEETRNIQISNCEGNFDNIKIQEAKRRILTNRINKLKKMMTLPKKM